MRKRFDNKRKNCAAHAQNVPINDLLDVVCATPAAFARAERGLLVVLASARGAS